MWRVNSVPQLPSHVWLFATPWIAAHQASLFITNSPSSPKLKCIESMMPSSHLILCCPLLLLSSFLIYAVNAINFPLLLLLHLRNFDKLCFDFHLVQKFLNFTLYFFFDLCDFFFFRNALFNIHIFENFTVFFLYWFLV